MKLYLVAGEASGDARGAELMRALTARDSSLEFFGAGGREATAALELALEITRLIDAAK